MRNLAIVCQDVEVIEPLFMLTAHKKNPNSAEEKNYIMNLNEIRRIKEEVEPELLRRNDVTGVDIGYKYVDGKKTDLLAIRIYVNSKKDVNEANALPKEIKGIPTDVIEGRFEPHFQDENKNTLNSSNKRKVDLQ